MSSQGPSGIRDRRAGRALFFVPALIALCLAAWAPSAAAQSTPGGTGTGSLSPGEDGTTVPVLGPDFSTGMHMVGSAREIRALVDEISGAGKVHLLRLGAGELLVSFEGTLTVLLDRNALASTNVAVFFRTARDFAPGQGHVSFNGRDLKAFRIGPTETVPIQVARLYQDPRRNPEVGLTVHNTEGRYGLLLQSRGDTVALIQRSGL